MSFNLCGRWPPLPRKQLNYRAFRDIDPSQPRHGIAQSALYDALSETSLETWCSVNCCIFKQKLLSWGPTHLAWINTPCCNDEVDNAACVRRQLEHSWKRFGHVIHHQIFWHQCTVVINTIRSVKCAYYISAVSEAGGDPRALLGDVKSLMHKRNYLPLPVHDSPAQLAEEFGAFFIDKITWIRSTLNAKQPVAAQHLGGVTILDTIVPATVTEVTQDY